ncbi:MAG: biotin transporter BioY [Candidatus Puniceispirillaceae bacterium]
MSHVTLAKAYFQARTQKTEFSLLNQAVLVVAGIALLAISAHVKIPFYPVPVTMQTLVVLMIGMTYGTRLGGVTLLAYLGNGAIGLPVFASGAGWAYMMGPTGGYLLGFFVAAIVLGQLAEMGWGKSLASTAAAMVIGNVVIYSFGVFWLSQMIGLEKAFQFGLLPFVYGDALKIVIAAGLMPFAWKAVQKLISKTDA